ncbi:MAG: arginase, partial [Actinomycetota bacterium]|nr:arginase [Actinomycetota bacterium]
MATFTFIGAPADSVLRGGGAEHAPARLRALGLADALGEDAGDLPVRIRGDARDPSTGIIAADDVLGTTRTVRDAVNECLSRGARPFVSGGCCAILPGAAAGARDILGRLGLVYVDGHQDMYDGGTSSSGEAADMPLGVAIGVGPKDWVEAAGGAAVSAVDTFLLGSRDLAEVQESGARAADSYGVTFSPLADVRDGGPEALGSAVTGSMRSRLQRYWLHLDVDVLDSELFPATDYLQPDGLSF